MFLLTASPRPIFATLMHSKDDAGDVHGYVIVFLDSWFGIRVGSEV